MPGPVALVGSGEYTEDMLAVERHLLEGRPSRYVQLPTAAELEGDDVVDRWVALGEAQADRIGVEAVPLRVGDRAAASDPVIVKAVSGAGLIYLSGGSPPHLARTLAGTRLWDAIVEEWEAGAAVAGCSAGAMALTPWVPDVRQANSVPVAGLGLVPHLRVVPHFDRIQGWAPRLAAAYASDLPPGLWLVGIDEMTALVNDDGQLEHWQVYGLGSVWVIDGDSRQQYRAGQSVELGQPSA
jgi:cyanophycinase